MIANNFLRDRKAKAKINQEREIADLDSLLDIAEMDYAKNTMDSHYDIRPQTPPPTIVIVNEQVPPPAPPTQEEEEEEDPQISEPPPRMPTPPQTPPPARLSEDVMDHIQAMNMVFPDDLLANPPPPMQFDTTPAALEVAPLSSEDELIRKHNKEREQKADLINDMQIWAEACKQKDRLELEQDLFKLPLPVLQDKHATWNSKNTLRKNLKKARDIWCAICMMTGYAGERCLRILQIESPIKIMEMVQLYCAKVVMYELADEPLRALCKYLISTQSTKGHMLDLVWTFVTFANEQWTIKQEEKKLAALKQKAADEKLDKINQERLLQRAREGQPIARSVGFFGNSNTAPPVPAENTTTTTAAPFEVPDVSLTDAQKVLRDLQMDDDDEEAAEKESNTTAQPRRSRRHR